MKNLFKMVGIIIVVSILGACSLPSWLTYTNATYHFKFNYPPASTIVTYTPLSARIQLPIAAGTNLVEKFMDVSVQEGAIPCLSPYSDAYGPPPGSLVSDTQTINGIYWVIENASEGAAGSIYTWVAYSTSNGETCVSLTFVLHSHHADAYPTPLPEFNQAGESLVFSIIVSTFEWLTPLTPTLVSTFTPTSVFTNTPTSVFTNTPTSVFTDTPTSVFTDTPTLPPAFYFVPKFNSNCRFGPNLIFESIGVAMQGQSYLIDGRNLENTWLYIMLDPRFGCWVPLENGTPSADTMQVRVLADIPTPTATPLPFNCGQFTDEKSCERYPNTCVWIPAVTNPGICQNR